MNGTYSNSNTVYLDLVNRRAEWQYVSRAFWYEGMRA